MPEARLPSKPQAPVFYELTEANTPSPFLVVFVNGLGLAAESWRLVVDGIADPDSSAPNVPTLIYDRYGQGRTTARDPLDSRPGTEPGYGHDLNDVVDDLEELLTVVASHYKKFIFVSASIGVHIARLYAGRHPQTVLAHLMLDSNVGNTTAVASWPDPASPGFKADDITAADCTLDDYLRSRATMARLFDPDVKNAEGLDRRNVGVLLPDPSSPKLESGDAKGPWLTIVGHDPLTFADENLERLSIPKSVVARFVQPPWDSYNRELLKLSDPDRTTGVVIAKGCSHFIQRDSPKFVIEELRKLISKI